MMNRLVASLAALGLVALLVVSSASADKPVRSFVPAEDFVLEDVCAFDVDAHVLANKEFEIAYSDGRARITGTLKMEFTNLSNPQNSVQANVSGPGVFTPTPDGGFVLKAQGPWFFFFFPGDIGPSGSALLTKGLAILEIDGSGNLSFTPPHNSTDLCALLA
jgi:hypothetical protein